MKNFIKNIRGVVMMEFVVTAPLYAMLFLGTVWLGEQSLARLKMVNSERTEVMAMASTGTDWWFCAEKQVSSTYTQEDWLDSWTEGLSFLVTEYYQLEDFVGESRTLTAQKRSDSTIPAVRWYRPNTSYGTKRADVLPADVSTWKAIVEEKLPGDKAAPTLGTLNSYNSYTRQENLLKLSGTM